MPLIPENLLNWYDNNARLLPWRCDPSPYRVWVSEIMLQQTQVETVIPYFERFMARFPNLPSLAQAEESEVLRLWEGLGYYSRARNLLKAAKRILSEFSGSLPADVTALKSLPGIGAYTAGAIASIAFGLPEPALDGNIRRVYLRILDLHEPPGNDTDAVLWQFARQTLPRSRPGDFNQALMDLGSSICSPAKPDCPRCPLQSACLAFQRGTQQQLPVRKPQAQVPHKVVTVAVILNDGKVLLNRRPPQGMLGGLWEYPGGAVADGTTDLPMALGTLLLSRYELPVEVEAALGVFRHAYTHFKITLHAFICALSSPAEVSLPSLFAWVPTTDLSACPMGKVARLISHEVEGILPKPRV